MQPTEPSIMSAATYPSTTYSFPVVILGGGFAGAYCARVLSAGLGRNAADAVALVADQNVMLFHPMLAEVSGSSISPLHVVNPLRRFCPGASIFRGAVEEVDLEAQTVRFSPGPFVPAATLKFEHLVLTIGSVVDVSRVPGMPEHGYLMKTVGDAIRLRVDLIQRLLPRERRSGLRHRRSRLFFLRHRKGAGGARR
jgi:NADH:ubiquinone reductase (H+-translocating)